MTEQPGRDQFAYTFENIAKVIGRFTEVLGLNKFAVYVFDYGAPVGFRLAVKHPERISAIVTQNGPIRLNLPASADPNFGNIAGLLSNVSNRAVSSV